MNFLVSHLLKTGNYLCFRAQIRQFCLPAVEIDWKWNDSLWSCVHSSIHTTCWQSTASIKAWRGRNSAFRIRIKEEGDDSGRAGGQKEGEMKQNECREMTRKERRETVLSRPAWTGREKRLWGEPEIKEDLETGRAAFCFFSWVTVCVWRATADPPRAHFTAQASINYQTSTLDIDRRLGC